MNLLFPVAGGVAALASVAFYRKRVKKIGVMTPERQQAFDEGMNKTLDVSKLRTLAEDFDKLGLSKEASLLRKRALLREAPKELKAKRKAVIQKALQSTDPAMVEKVAQACEEIGAMGNAAALREYAKGLTAKP